jgi:hypothetical protein
MLTYFILHPDAPWSLIQIVFTGLSVSGLSKETSDGYIRMCTGTPPPESEYIIPCTADSEFVTPNGEIVAGL